MFSHLFLLMFHGKVLGSQWDISIAKTCVFSYANERIYRGDCICVRRISWKSTITSPFKF